MKKKEYEIPWWEEWIEADALERRKKVEGLPFVKEVLSLVKTSKLTLKQKKEIIAMQLNAFFEDLESAMHTKLK